MIRGSNFQFVFPKLLINETVFSTCHFNATWCTCKNIAKIFELSFFNDLYHIDLGSCIWLVSSGMVGSTYCISKILWPLYLYFLHVHHTYARAHTHMYMYIYDICMMYAFMHAYGNGCNDSCGIWGKFSHAATKISNINHFNGWHCWCWSLCQKN